MLNPERDLSRSPLFQVFLNLLDIDKGDYGFGKVRAEFIQRADALSSKFDLTLYAAEALDGIHLSLVYNTDLFGEDRIDMMLRHFENLLTTIVNCPDGNLSTLRLVAQDEARQPAGGVLQNAPQKLAEDSGIGESIPELFLRQVKQHPEYIAVETGNYKWTYQELDAVANELARRLLERFGDDDNRIGLVLDHDAPMVAALLGVLKAGKAYVPLDPS